MNEQRAQIGRGAGENASGRFEKIRIEDFPTELRPDWPVEEEPKRKTEFFRDHSRTAITTNSSPDIPFSASINPYRGCEHGCAYCYARPTHEYLGFSAGLDFETRIFVKQDAPALLRKKMLLPSWKPEVVTMSGITDCYQPAERRFRVTRGCLEVLAEFRNPVTIITKNHLVTRDIDVLAPLAALGAAAVYVSVTTLDSELCGVMEPRTSRPAMRLKAIEALAAAGIPVGVMVAPVIPGLTDHEVPSILAAAARAGAQTAGYVPLRLPGAVAEVFEEWLGRQFPDRKEKVLNRVRSMRGGRLNDPRFGERMRGQGPFAELLRSLFEKGCRANGLNRPELRRELTTEHFIRPGEQLSLSI